MGSLTKRRALANNHVYTIAKRLKENGVQIDYSKDSGLQLVAMLTTSKAFQIEKYDEYDYDEYNRRKRVNAVVGYIIKNNGEEPCRYLKATYGDKEISYAEAFINPGEEAIITRHELYGLRLFNGARIHLPDEIEYKNNKKLPDDNVCVIVTSTYIPRDYYFSKVRRNFTPYIKGVSCSLRKNENIQISVDDFDEQSKLTRIKPEYQERFSWLLDRNFFKNIYIKKERKKRNVVDVK